MAFVTLPVPRSMAAARALELPAAALEAALQRGERLRGRRHEPAESLGEHLVHVLGAYVGMAARNLVLLADGEDLVDRGGDRGMLVLAREAEVLREIALADQHHADARHLLEHFRQIADRPDLLAHDD